ncbi:MAG: OmpA family protein [Lachnospiraceae bacterium]|nr:OmpA family protein [Lachnospiraceae bacterium]
MRNKRRNREAFAEHSFWQSYSDMMAALLLIFILMIAITLAIYKQKTIDLDQTKLDYAVAQQELDNAQKELSDAQKELDIAKLDLESSRLEIEQSNQELAASLAELQQAYDKAALTQQELNNAYLEIQSAQQELEVTKSELQDIVGIRTDIIGALQSTFHNSSMTVDAQTGSIMFSSDVLFRYNSANLTNESKETLQEVIPIYLDVLLQDQYRNYIAEIIIEGHTDTDGSYQSNMELSYKRANAVAKFCLDKKNGLSEEEIEQLQMLLTVNGRSYSDPIYEVDNADEIDMAASRRVEIKFRLKEDEMIEKIAAILEQE